MNNPVSFELAKLLKESGFDEETRHAFTESGDELYCDPGYYTGLGNKQGHRWWNSKEQGCFSRPFVVDVVMWLYKKHGIWVYCYSVAPHLSEDEQYPKIVFVSKVQKFKEFDIFIDKENGLAVNHYYSPTEAYEAAIEYCLDELINKYKNHEQNNH